MVQRKRRGRPPKGTPGGKTAAFSTRITPELRAKLQAASASNSLSLSEEIERRLWRTFHLDEDYERMFAGFGGRQNYAVCRLFAELMTQLSEATGKRWTDDTWTFDQVKEGILRLLRQWRPEGDPVKPALRNSILMDNADQLGTFFAMHQLAGLAFTDPNELHRTAAPDSRLRTFPRIKDDLGDLAERGGPINEP